MLRLDQGRDGNITLDGKLMDFLTPVQAFEFGYIAGNLFRKDGYLENELYFRIKKQMPAAVKYYVFEAKEIEKLIKESIDADKDLFYHKIRITPYLNNL